MLKTHPKFDGRDIEVLTEHLLISDSLAVTILQLFLAAFFLV